MLQSSQQAANTLEPGFLDFFAKDIALSSDIIYDDDTSWSYEPLRMLKVLKIVLFVRIDEDKVERRLAGLHLRERLRGRTKNDFHDLV